MTINSSKSHYSTGELARMVDGELIGEEDCIISKVSSVKESSADSVTFAENKKYMEQVQAAAAGLVIIPEDSELEGKNVLKVENPRLAYARIASLFEPDPYYNPGIHKTAVVDNTARIEADVSINAQVVIEEDVHIAEGVRIAPGVYIGAGSSIGKDTIIHPGVIIEYDSQIGNNVIIHAGTIIGADGFGYVSTDEGHHKIPQLGNVIIEDEVEIGANVTIDRAASDSTVIGSGTKIDNLVQIGHNVRIGRDSLIVAQTGIAGSAKLGERVILAGHSGVKDHVEVGANTVIAASSVVTKDTPEGVFYSGYPAHDHRQELKEQAARRKLPQLLKRVQQLEKKINKLEKE